MTTEEIIKIQEEWFQKGEQYAQSINEMVAYGEKHGWENWKGEEAEDTREHLGTKVIKLLREANRENKVEEFRKQFPPAHSPIVSMLDEKGQSITQFCFLENDKIIFVVGSAYEDRQAYLLNDDELVVLDKSITSVGKAPKGNVIAIANGTSITTFKEWCGEEISSFNIPEIKGSGITKLIPYNNGLKVVVVSSAGIYLLSSGENKLVHPEYDAEDEDWSADIDMENAVLSFDNKYIVVGDQCYDHAILNEEGDKVGSVGPQSSYPHYCLFSKDDEQLITNSCHFYNGVTIGVDTKKLNGLEIEAYEESDDYVYIDENMRVYAGVAKGDYYILGDAYGYIKGINKEGKVLWKHFLGSTIDGMTLSDDEQTLWVGTYAGILHKLKFGKGVRDTHTIGDADLYEEFRLLIWKNEPQIWKW